MQYIRSPKGESQFRNRQYVIIMVKTDLDDDTQKVRCNTSGSLTEEHLKYHQPTTIIGRSILHMRPLEGLYSDVLVISSCINGLKSCHIPFLTPSWSSETRLTAIAFSLSLSHETLIGESGRKNHYSEG